MATRPGSSLLSTSSVKLAFFVSSLSKPPSVRFFPLGLPTFPVLAVVWLVTYEGATSALDPSVVSALDPSIVSAPLPPVFTPLDPSLDACLAAELPPE